MQLPRRHHSSIYTVPLGKTNYGTLRRFFCKTLLLDLKMFFDSGIKLVELYTAVENVLPKNFSIFGKKRRNVPYRPSPYKI